MSRFAYSTAQGFAGIPGLLPFIPIIILRTNNLNRIDLRVKVPALVDSGSTVNVLPYDIGRQLGFVWNAENPETPVIGTLYGLPALGVKLFVKVERYAPVQLGFGWLQESDMNVPLLLGQTNFFDEFDVDFRKSTDYFEIVPVRS